MAISLYQPKHRNWLKTPHNELPYWYSLLDTFERPIFLKRVPHTLGQRTTQNTGRGARGSSSVQLGRQLSIWELHFFMRILLRINIFLYRGFQILPTKGFTRQPLSWQISFDRFGQEVTQTPRKLSIPRKALTRAKVEGCMLKVLLILAQYQIHPTCLQNFHRNLISASSSTCQRYSVKWTAY